MSQDPTQTEDAQGAYRRWCLPFIVLSVPLLLLADFGRVQLRLHQMVARVTWGDTERQVEQKLGEPDSRGTWAGSSGHGGGASGAPLSVRLGVCARLRPRVPDCAQALLRAIFVIRVQLVH